MKKIQLQIGLRRLLILTLCAGTWIAYWTNRMQIQKLQLKLASLQELARELIVLNPAQLAIVGIDFDLDTSDGWDCYIPDSCYALCMATRDIDASGLPDKYDSTPLPAGRYVLSLKERELRTAPSAPSMTSGKFSPVVISLERDGAVCIEKTESDDWRTTYSSSSSGHGTISKQHDGKVPVELLRKRIHIQVSAQSTSAPTGPGNGVLLWIQRR